MSSILCLTINLAESVGFEPTDLFTGRLLSKQVQSATLPTLQITKFWDFNVPVGLTGGPQQHPKNYRIYWLWSSSAVVSSQPPYTTAILRLAGLYNFLNLVRVTGFEPATTWFQAKHSTRLSYTLIIQQKTYIC